MPSKRFLRPLAAVMLVYLAGAASCQRRDEPPLAPGRSVRGEIAAGEQRSWSVALAAGEVMELQLLQDPDEPLRVEVRGPDDDRLFQRAPDPFLYVAGPEGVYEIWVLAPAKLARPAHYEVRRLPTRAIDDHKRRELHAS